MNFHRRQLWSLPLTPFRTAVGPAITFDINYSRMGTKLNGGVIFSIGHNSYGQEPWWTDGTPENTWLLGVRLFQSFVLSSFFPNLHLFL